MRYGFIGFGNLARAIHNGLSHDTTIEFGCVTRSERSNAIRSFETIGELAVFADVIWICVKPQDATEVLEELKVVDLSGKLIVSPMAGKTIASIERALEEKAAIVRIMPNLAIAYGRSAIAYASNDVASPHADTVKSGLTRLGTLAEIPEERFDLFTALFGSGPAFLLEILSSFKTKALELDISEKQTNDLLFALLDGTAAYLEHNKDAKTIEEMIAAITSKGGTTEAGLAFFRNDGATIITGTIEAATARGKELGKQL